MSFIFTGIGGLKKINSLLKSKVNSTLTPVGKGEGTAALKDINLTSKSKNIVTAEIRFNGDILMAGDKNKKIQDLIQKRVLCEEAIRLKQELKNFSSVWLSRIS